MVKGLPAEWGTCFRTVVLHDDLESLASWKDTVAAGLDSGEIIVLDGTTGIQTAILSGHTDWVTSLTFLSDGISLVSGSYDQSIKLWDMQTGGVVKTFHGHTGHVCSVSISANSSMIASGSDDRTIRLWDIETGGCNQVIEQENPVQSVIFSSIHSQYLISVSGQKVQQWGIDGHQLNCFHHGSCAAFSSDGTQVVICEEDNIVLQNSNSGVIVSNFQTPGPTAKGCCFSPDGRLVAVAAEDNTVYIWNITGSDPCLVETLVGHTGGITTLVFSSPSSLITSSWDESVRFWQIETPPTDPVVGHPKFTPLAPVPITSITLQAKDGIFVSCDLDGMVKTWDISTGLHKTSLQTPAKNTHHSDIRLVNDRLILVWHADQMIHVWDVEKEELLHETPWPTVECIRLSGDGSKVFCISSFSMSALAIWTGEVLSGVNTNHNFVLKSLIVNGSRVWIHSPYFPVKFGYDFGITGLSPVKLTKGPPFYLSDTKLWDFGLSSIKDTTTGKVVLKLSGRFANPMDVQLDGCYFLAHYRSGKVLILDFNHVLLW